MQLGSESLPKSRVRMAFSKYGLSQIVYNEGEYDNFKFEIIERCQEDVLLARESHYITTLKPEYNCDIYTHPEAYSGVHENRKKKIWVQYHNNHVMGFWPAEDVFDSIEDPNLSDAHHYTTSRKRSVYYSKGDDLYMIVGQRIKGKTYYLAWTKTIIEDVEVHEDDSDDRVLWMIGEQKFCYPPTLLNELDGFQTFLKQVGNFGLGLTSIGDKEFAKTLEYIFNSKSIDEDGIKFLKYLEISDELALDAHNRAKTGKSA